MNVNELREVLDLHPEHGDAPLIIELLGTERPTQAVSWHFTPDGVRLLVLADL